MDALPINETINVPYKSVVAGVKHACGHDVHTTVELGVAEVLSKMRGQIPGSVKFLFQPAEEGPPKGEEGGAKLMIKEGALDNPRPLAIFGMHCTPELEVGKIGFRAGPAQAAADEVDLTIHGKMGHAAFPHRGVDAIVVASECVLALQNIRSRRTDVNDPFILTIGTIQGGTRRSIIADDVRMQGTLRSLTSEMRSRVHELSRQTLAGICAAYDATFDLSFTEISTFVYNDPKLVAETLPAIRRAIGEANVVEVPVRMGSEDFSYFQTVIPGFYFRLGTGNKAKGITADIHTPDFDVDEECLTVGVKTMANVLLDFLERHAAKTN